MKITPLQAAVATVGAVAVLGGTTFGVIKIQDNAAKERARIAYENRAIVEASCVMNGFGQGSCNFTNTGKSSGSQCGHIQVNGPGIVNSDKFCSGQVASQSTEKVEFTIPAVNDLCDNGFEPWTNKCSFTFVADGLNNGKTTEA